MGGRGVGTHGEPRREGGSDGDKLSCTLPRHVKKLGRGPYSVLVCIFLDTEPPFVS